MKDSLIFGFVVSAAAITAILILFNLIDKGEPRIAKAVIMGVIITVANIAIYSWMRKQNSKSDKRDET